jgi:hypothetical protein
LPARAHAPYCRLTVRFAEDPPPPVFGGLYILLRSRLQPSFGHQELYPFEVEWSERAELHALFLDQPLDHLRLVGQLRAAGDFTSNCADPAVVYAAASAARLASDSFLVGEDQPPGCGLDVAPLHGFAHCARVVVQIVVGFLLLCALVDAGEQSVDRFDLE